MDEEVSASGCINALFGNRAAISNKIRCRFYRKGVGKRTIAPLDLKKIKVVYAKLVDMEGDLIQQKANYSSLYCYPLHLEKFLPTFLVHRIS